MTTVSILAMAMVICLFGGYVDSVDAHKRARHDGYKIQRPFRHD